MRCSLERPARLLVVHVGQAPVLRPAGRDHHVVDRPGQAAKNRRSAAGSLASNAAVLSAPSSVAACSQALRFAAGQNDAGALGLGAPGHLQADAGAAADHDDRLPRSSGSRPAAGRRLL